MKFRDKFEKKAWSSAWDAVGCAGVRDEFCAKHADAKIEAMRVRKADPAAAIKTEAPDPIPDVKPMKPPRSERGALERLKTYVEGMSGTPTISKTTLSILIDAELARQPADELSPKVKAVVEAANQLMSELHIMDLAAPRFAPLIAAVKALDEEAK